MKIVQIKNYWDSRPCNIKHSKAELGTKRYFDEVEQRKYFVEPHIPKFAEFEKWNGKRVLEIGCGIGTDAVNFARNGAIYTGLELSETSLEITKNRFKVFNLQGTFYQGDAERLDQIIPVQKFDLIYSFGVIHHTLNPKLVIGQIEKYMDLNSEFRLMLYSKHSTKNFMIKVGLDQPEAQKGCPIAYTYSVNEIRNLLDGFQVVSIKKDHIFPYIVEDYVRHIYNKKMWVRMLPNFLMRFLEHKFGWHTLIICKRPDRKREIRKILE